MKAYLSTVILLPLCILVLAGCDNIFGTVHDSINRGGGGFVPVTAITGVRTSMNVGADLNLAGNVEPEDATYRHIVWSITSDTSGIAALSGGNLLQASVAGSLTLQATIVNGLGEGQDYVQNFPISVSADFVPVAWIHGIPNGVMEDTVLTLNGVVAPDNATNQNIDWSLITGSGPGVSLDGNTLTLPAGSAGPLTLQAVITNGAGAGSHYTQDFPISVSSSFVPVTGITGTLPMISRGGSLMLTGAVLPFTATDTTITWSVVNDGGTGAKVESGSGGQLLTTTAAGIATLRATVAHGMMSGSPPEFQPYTQDFSIPVFVSFVPVTAITGVRVSMNTGTDLFLSGIVEPEDATYHHIVWSITSDASGSAVLSDLNLLHAPVAGSLTLRATIVNGLAEGQDYVQNFPISVSADFVPVAWIHGIPNGVMEDTVLTLNGVVAPDNATNQNIVWSLIAGSGVILNGNTLTLPAGSAGPLTLQAVITNGAGTGDYTQDFPISVSSSFVPVTGITGTLPMITRGGSLTLTGVVLPFTATDTTITWSVVNDGGTGAKVENGSSGQLLTTTAAGTATLRATVAHGMMSGSPPEFQPYTQDFTIPVIVNFVPVTAITGVRTSMNAGIDLNLAGNVQPENATYHHIVWSITSDTSGIAALSDGNLLHAPVAGSLTLQATIVNGLAEGQNYVQNFPISVSAGFVPVAWIHGIPNGVMEDTILTLNGVVAPDNATNQNIDWSISGTAISGNTLTLPPGSAGTLTLQAVITNGATGGDYIQNFPISVSSSFVPVTGITGTLPMISKGVSLPLTGAVQPPSATDTTITWMVVNDGGTGAKVENDGSGGQLLTTTAAGIATLRATVAHGRRSGSPPEFQPYTQDLSIPVLETFVDVADITLASQTVEALETLTLSPTVLPANATNQTIVWTMVNDGGIGASINGSSFSAMVAGTVVIRASIANGINGSGASYPYYKPFVITVTPPPIVAVTGISNVPTSMSEGTLNLSGTVYPVNATNKNITWSVMSYTSGIANAAMDVTGKILTTALNTTPGVVSFPSTETVTVRATITNGTSPGTNYTQDFTINVRRHIAIEISGAYPTNRKITLAYKLYTPEISGRELNHDPISGLWCTLATDPPPSNKVIKSITTYQADNSTEAQTILIGRNDLEHISLQIDDTGQVQFRPASGGFIPIGSYAEFQLISANLGGSYAQEGDLDLLGDSGGGTQNWTPIGPTALNTIGFTGVFDGVGKKINNIYINSSNSSVLVVGLFGVLSNGGKIQNVHITNGSIGTVSGGATAGGIAGMAYSNDFSVTPAITGCSNAASIRGRWVGGILGATYPAGNPCNITACLNTGDVQCNSTAGNSGGIVGLFTNGSIIACYNTGNISGGNLATPSSYAFVGGIAGNTQSQSPVAIIACYNTGTVTNLGNQANSCTGGLTGFAYGGTFTACYNIGSVSAPLTESGTVPIGGLAGLFTTTSTYTDCYWDSAASASNQAYAGHRGTLDSHTPYTPPSGATTFTKSSGNPCVSYSPQWGTGTGGDNHWWKSGTTSTISPKLYWEE